MILVDANLLLYAENANAPTHRKAVEWWDGELSTNPEVCLTWQVVSAFVRISTNARVFTIPLTTQEACERVRTWLVRPNVRIIQPTEKHWAVFQKMLLDGQAVGNLVSDAHLAAIAIEHDCELNSTDADFARFPKLRWRNPLA